jgi:predicted acylesterase/phospholipase RssA
MREWQIILECRADSVVLERTNQRFELAKLSGHGNPLAAAVADLIIKKRERLPDVRPELKFHIRPEGLRAYYAAAAALEPLALPAKWEVVRE